MLSSALTYLRSSLLLLALLSACAQGNLDGDGMSRDGTDVADGAFEGRVIPDGATEGPRLGDASDGPGDDGDATGNTCAAPCDDNLPCTEDRCVAGRCEYVVTTGCLIDGACVSEGEGDDRQTTESCRVCDSTRSTESWSDDASLCPQDALDCTRRHCEQGVCSQALLANSCLIDSKCFAAGDLEPGQECTGCNPSKRTDAFSELSDGTPCAADILSCTDDICEQGSCTHPLKETACLIDGKCVDSGHENPSASCLYCDPKQHVGTWTQRKDGDPCRDDTLECTVDSCERGTCKHALKADRCLIGGACFKGGDPKPQDKCAACQPLESTASWTPATDGTPCDDDALSCTTDSCKAGTCNHELLANSCLIANTCYAQDAPIDGAGCTICMPARSQDGATSVDGKACSDGNAETRADTCLAGTCRGFQAYMYGGQTDTDTEVRAVAPVEGLGYWLAGARKDAAGEMRGFLATTAGSQITLLLLPSPMSGIHHRLAVGDQGLAFYHDGTGWAPATGITTHLGATSQKDVWGTRLGTDHSFYLAGASMARCTTANNGGAFSCQNDATVSGPVSAITGHAANVQGPIWAGASSGDIHHSSNGVGFSRHAPRGCTGGAATICDRAINAIWAHSATEAWAVGDAGLVLRHDGSGWASVAIPNLEPAAPQGTYTFRDVSGADSLVMLVGERTIATQYRQMVVLIFNRDLDRWFTPRPVAGVELNDPHQQSFRLTSVGARTGNPPVFAGSVWDPGSGKQLAFYLTTD